jgi:MSHA biogenesis protein MshE
MTRAKRQRKIRIGDLLVEQGVITSEQLAEALAEQKQSGQRLGRTVVDLGFTTEHRVLEVLAQQLDIPLIDLRHYHYDPEVVRQLPERIARRFRAILLDDNDHALVGMADPTDLFAQDQIGEVLGKRIRTAVVREADLLDVFDQVYRRTGEISSLAEKLGEEIAGGGFDIGQLAGADEVEDAPVIHLLQNLFEDAVGMNASDIHIEPDETVLRIRQRIDGELQEHVIEENRIAPAVVLRLKLIAGLDISEKRLPQDGRFNIRVRGRTIDVRLSTMPVQFGESVVMRLLDQGGKTLELEHLGMPTAMLERFQRMLHHPHGVILVTGPTGSGKTTTLYAALHELNRPRTKIITVEDPVEYRLPRVNQIQVRPGIGLTFANVLRSALRQDPDVILLGEMRDQETAEIGLRAAMTGHLVLSTLHTNDAVSVGARLLDMGAEGYLVAATLRAVIAQRLVRRICEACVQDYTPDEHERAWLLGQGRDPDDFAFRKGAGCPKCNNTGYRGRVGVFEYLEPGGEMLDALRREDTSGFVAAARHQGRFMPMIDNALDYARQGITTLQEVIRIIGEIEEIDRAAFEQARTVEESGDGA